MRFRVNGNKFDVYHGGVKLYANGDDVFKDFITFLSNHSSETILLSYKEDRDPNPIINISPRRFQPPFSPFRKILHQYVAKYSKYLFQSDKLIQNIPKMQEVRGKIVLIDQGHGGIGIVYNLLDIKDEWVYSGEESKLQGVKEHLLQASKSSGEKLFLTYTSASSYNFFKPKKFGPIGTIDYQKYFTNYEIARGATWIEGHSVNNTIIGMTIAVENMLMELKKSSKTFGITIVDYPTPKTLGAIIRHNKHLKICAVLEDKERSLGQSLYEGSYLYRGISAEDKVSFVHLPKGCQLKLIGYFGPEPWKQKCKYFL